MVEVVTSEEFSEFLKSIEGRLNALEGKLGDLAKRVKEDRAQAKDDLEKALRDIDERIDDLAESSKGFVDRVREAFSPRVAEPSDEQEESKPREKTERTLSKVAEIIIKCPNFFNWDLCQVNCPLYQLCDNISAVQDASKLSQKTSTDRLKEILKQFISTAFFKSEEHLRERVLGRSSLPS